MNTKSLIVAALVIVGAFGAYVAVKGVPSESKKPQQQTATITAPATIGQATETGASLDAFAQCLTDSGAVLYGAEWCPHCKNQKALFGESVKYAPYVECTVETEKCQAAGIEGFPTWVLKDGTKLVGEQSLQTLAAKTACQLPQ